MKSNHSKEDSKCLFYLQWFLQFYFWFHLCIIIVICIIGPNPAVLFPLCALLFTVYFNWLLLAFWLQNEVYLYLRNKSKSNSINEYMEKLFYSAPQFTIETESYHNKHLNRGKGRRRRKIIITNRNKENFRYCSWLDISGLFELNEENLSNKPYIKLELALQFDFNEEMTSYDYKNLKENIIKRNEKKDDYLHYTESLNFFEGGYEKFNLISVGKKEPFGLNLCLYILFSIIPLVQFYKIYFNSQCSTKLFTIKKVVSSRYNLNLPELRSKYADDIPRFNFYNDETIFNKSPQNFEKIYEIPTEEELLQAQKFKDENLDAPMRMSTNDNIKKKKTKKEGEGEEDLDDYSINTNNQKDLNVELNAKSGPQYPDL